MAPEDQNKFNVVVATRQPSFDKEFAHSATLSDMSGAVISIGVVGGVEVATGEVVVAVGSGSSSGVSARGGSASG